MNVGNIFTDIEGWIGLLQPAADKGLPVAATLVSDVGGAVTTLVGIGKDLFAGKKPTPAQLQAAEDLRHKKDALIAAS